jgi:hypothetical protein
MNSRRLIFWPMLRPVGFSDLSYSSVFLGPCRCIRVCRSALLPPCLTIRVPQPPSGDIWLHELHHRRRSSEAVVLGNDESPVTSHSC